MRSEPLDDFADLSGWTPVASSLAELRLSPESGPDGESATITSCPSQVVFRC